MTDPMDSITHQTPHGALLNLPELYSAVVFAGGLAHGVFVLREEGGAALVSNWVMVER